MTVILLLFVQKNKQNEGVVKNKNKKREKLGFIHTFRSKKRSEKSRYSN